MTYFKAEIMADDGLQEAQAATIALASARRIKEYEMRREGHHHEWILLTSRVTAYLTSQSLLAAGTALLFANRANGKDLESAILFLALIGLCVTFLSSIAICINLRVIHDWHIYISTLIEDDQEKKNGKSDDYLKGFYIDRKQPDTLHKISTNLFCLGITVIGGIAWLSLISKFGYSLISTDLLSYLIVTFAATWFIILLYIYKKWSLWGDSRPRVR